ncbi:hypothetical protein [Planomonospora sp. ID82291]|nr:hypothetical protein [Planomonospora sp. ID82291]
MFFSPIAMLVLFSRSGFTDDLKAAAVSRSLLVDLPGLYGTAS